MFPRFGTTVVSVGLFPAFPTLAAGIMARDLFASESTSSYSASPFKVFESFVNIKYLKHE